MVSLTWANVRARFGRLLMISLAVAAAVGFVSGSFSLTGAVHAAIYDESARAAANVAARATGAEPFTERELAMLRALPGVAAVQPRVRNGDVRLVRADGALVRMPGRPDLSLFLAPVDPRLSDHRLAAGQLPNRPGELLVHEVLAAQQGWRPGDQVRVLDQRGAARPFVLAGTVRGGLDDGVVGLLPPDHLSLLPDTERDGWPIVDVAAQPGAATDVHRTVADILRSRAEVISGAEYAQRLAGEVFGDSLTMIILGLQLFAWLAVLVAAVVVYNTFAVVLAQRHRELALMRCVGAGRGQVFGAVMLESTVVGLLAAVIGYLAGWGVAVIGYFGLRSIGVPVPEHFNVTFSATAAAVAPLVGISVTVLAAVLPARAATRVPPVRALASQAETIEQPRLGRLRLGAGILLLAGGATLAVLSGLHRQPLIGIGGGGLVMTALLALGPVVVGPLARMVGWPGRIFGVTGRLAAANGTRNPRRMAAATNALALGIGLVTVMLVGAASMRASADSVLAGNYPVDFVLAARDSGTPRTLPPDLASRLAALPEFDQPLSASVGSAETSAADNSALSSSVNGYEPADLRRRLPATAVTAGGLADFGPGAVILSASASRTLGDPAPGSTVTVRAGSESGSAASGSPAAPEQENPPASGSGERSARLRVAAVVSGGFDGTFGALMLTRTDFAGIFGAAATDRVLLWSRPGTDATRARDAIDRVIAALPDVEVADPAADRARTSQIFDRLLAGGGLLTAMSILVAVIGMTVTLTLSVVERTREFALLRALGLTKTQVYGTLAVEGAIMAAIAAVVGTVLGVALGVAGSYALFNGEDDLRITVPVGAICLLVACSALVGVVAALPPARRAARVAPVSALAAG